MVIGVTNVIMQNETNVLYFGASLLNTLLRLFADVGGKVVSIELSAIYFSTSTMVSINNRVQNKHSKA